tara:strand:+ start:18147 stop:18608 length:462 start_codon:yes stop_codon:yes gene_type:complete
MFKPIYIFLIALSGCIADSSTITETVTGKEVSTQIQQSPALANAQQSSVITITVEEIVDYQNLKLRLIAVEDSRCATGVTCIWAGQLIVKLEVSNEYSEKQEVKLIRKRESTMANTFGYSLLLLDVEPHPKKGKDIQLSDQIIKLNIQKIDEN